MMQELPKEMANPPNSILIMVQLFCTLLFISGGLYILADSTTRIYSATFVFSIGVLLGIYFFWFSMVNTPVGVIIKDEGMTLNFRFWNNRDYSWYDIESVGETDCTDTYFRVLGRFAAYPIKGVIAQEIRRFYSLRMGSYPLTYEEFKANKKRRVF